MTLFEFIKEYIGKFLDHDGVWGYQCMDLLRRYERDVLHKPYMKGVDYAAELWDIYPPEHYDRVDYNIGLYPWPGDIVIWGFEYGPYGHVAIVVYADETGMLCASQNDPTGKKIGIVLYTFDEAKGFKGWLVPKDLTICTEEENGDQTE